MLFQKDENSIKWSPNNKIDSMQKKFFIPKSNRITKMKFFSLLGVALAKECFEAVLPTGVRVERGEVSVGELNVAIEEFAACAERDANVDVTPFYEAQTKGTDKSSNFKKKHKKYLYLA